MGEYKHILVGLDLTEECRHVARRACALSKAFSCQISCLHVVEPLSLAYGGDIPMDLSTIQDQIQDTAKTHLKEFATSLGIPDENQYLIFGRPESEIHSLAEQISADLIVVGTHGRQGLALLLGSTSSGVLHGSPVDVLAVRV